MKRGKSVSVVEDERGWYRKLQFTVANRSSKTRISRENEKQGARAMNRDWVFQFGFYRVLRNFKFQRGKRYLISYIYIYI